MSNQVYFEDVTVGQELPVLRKEVTTVNILMYAATVWLMDRIHYDYLFATQKRGLPDAVAPGPMALDFYAQLLTDWAGEEGEVRKLSGQHRNFMLPGEILECGGKVTRTFIKEGKGHVELELSLKNPKGINCVPGKATVELPVRKAGNK
jgi:hydroxyacyl-ACP dehydratase HTD2-like protein with hotdog domain